MTTSALADAGRVEPAHLLVTANAAWNVWNFRRPLVERWLADGRRVTVLAPADETAPRLEDLGCRFLPLAMNPKGLNPWSELSLLARLVRTFRRERPDAVVAFTIKNNIFGALAARLHGVPFIPNVTGLGTAFLSGAPLRTVAEALYRIAFARTPVVFFQNEDDLSLFTRRGLVDPAQARLLPGSGVDLQFFCPQPDPISGQPTFLLISRLLRDKGVHEFVEAARRIRRNRPDVRFQILGPLDALNRSAVSADTLSAWLAEGVVEHLGVTSDVRPYIAAAHCVVLPSYREGAPRTLIEAGAMARPAIATDVPGCRSVVEDGVTGLLCLPRDAHSLAQAVDRFLRLSDDERRAMGAAARERMERRFDQSVVVGHYQDALNALLPHARVATR